MAVDLPPLAGQALAGPGGDVGQSMPHKPRRNNTASLLNFWGTIGQKTPVEMSPARRRGNTLQTLFVIIMNTVCNFQIFKSTINKVMSTSYANFVKYALKTMKTTNY